jgi:hypothetical protein
VNSAPGIKSNRVIEDAICKMPKKENHYYNKNKHYLFTVCIEIEGVGSLRMAPRGSDGLGRWVLRCVHDA